MDAAAIYESAANGEIKALFVLGADPVGDGLLLGRDQLDFLVVQELFLTETAALADVVLPAQSWVERDGTFTSAERRVQRYYPAIPPVGESRPDWQILALLNERVGLGAPPFAASLVFGELAKAVPQYKGMDYRSLAQVEKQWPNVGGDDLYYGGNAYENRSGLGQQWPASSAGGFEIIDAPDSPFLAQTDGLCVVRIAALYTPGTLLNQSPIIASRFAPPTLFLNLADAHELGLSGGDQVTFQINGRSITATAKISSQTPEGVALLRGVPFMPVTSGVQVTKIEDREKEMVA
jgi:NADH-quinone oxidoreductase subunit G